ncbi:uncharacterized protein YjdB [Dysgonomonadaceae bacterium PH5-43]|nr:uncharacterized protein YjdB [Dysgonomonadaceae bacterium PH5-43]
MKKVFTLLLSAFALVAFAVTAQAQTVRDYVTITPDAGLVFESQPLGSTPVSKTITITNKTNDEVNFCAFMSFPREIDDADFIIGGASGRDVIDVYLTPKGTEGDNVVLTVTPRSGLLAGEYVMAFKIYTGNRGGEIYSVEYTVTDVAKSPQTITFDALAEVTVGDEDFAPGATASSGLEVSYTSSDETVATIVDGKIHIVAEGTTTITASQDGNDEYEAATPVTQILTVNAKTENIFWKFEDGTLTVWGEGEMPDYKRLNDIPWYSHITKDEIKTIIIKEGVTSVGQFAFVNCVEATSVSLPSTLTSIGVQAFGAGYGLSSITIPETVTVIKSGAFSYCLALTEVTVLNPVPVEIEASVFGNVDIANATLYVPKGTKAVYQDATVWENFGTIIQEATLVTGVSLDKTTLELIIDETEQLTATIEPANADNKNTTWSSSDESVATVSETGLVTAIAAGTATITVTTEDGGFKAECGITVNKKSQTITFDALTEVTVGDKDFTPGATASSGLEVSYTSSDETVATIVDGKIHIVAEGTTTITASQAGNDEYEAATPVTQELTVKKLSSIDNFNTDSIEVYVYADMLYIDSTDKITKISIYSLSGAIVYNQTNATNAIDVSNLAKGTYIVKLSTDKDTVVCKVIK